MGPHAERGAGKKTTLRARRDARGAGACVGTIEQRLDVLVFRLRMARSIFEARQIITHGHVKVWTSDHAFATVAPKAGGLAGIARRRGSGYIVPVGSLITSSADTSLAAYLSRASRGPMENAPVGGYLLSLPPLS